MLYPFPPDGFPSSNARFVGAFLATVGGVVVAAMPLLQGQAFGYTALCWLSFLVVLLPTLGIVSSHGHFTMCADRYAYMATMPFVPLLTATIHQVFFGENTKPKKKSKEDSNPRWGAKQIALAVFFPLSCTQRIGLMKSSLS